MMSWDAVGTLAAALMAFMALNVADRGYVLETGRMVLQGPSEELLSNKDVQRAYLGRSPEGIA